jgi:nickel-type superoxide dismutase maturation protease
MQFLSDPTQLLARVEVSGLSMAPTLRPGDRLLVARWPRLRPGHVIALRDPRRSSRILVKRLVAVDGEHLTVMGDNPDASTDSRHFGAVPKAAVLGLVVYRYFPAPQWFPGGGVGSGDGARKNRGTQG